MVIFLIVLTILFLIALIFLLLCLSNLEIEIKKLSIDSKNEKSERISEILIYIRLKLLDKVTLLKVKIDKNKINSIKNSKLLKSKMFNKMNKKEMFKRDNIKYIKEINFKIKQVDLTLKLCTTDSIFTSFSVAGIASIISILLSKHISKKDINKCKYVIIPQYEQKPSIKIKLNCIISIKIVHIMNVIYMLIKKRSVENDERTSDRRTYASFNE